MRRGLGQSVAAAQIQSRKPWGGLALPLTCLPRPPPETHGGPGWPWEWGCTVGDT